MKRVKLWWLGFVTRLFEKARSIYPEGWDMYVKQSYQLKRMQENFILNTKQINVKKGKRKYTLLVMETKDGQVKFNLGRH